MKKKELGGDEVVRRLVYQIVALQARCDALDALTKVLARRLGADGKQWDRVLGTSTGTALQKRLEEIEAVDPALAAELDERSGKFSIDPDLLKNLYFDS